MVEIVKSGTKNLADCIDCGSTLKYVPRDVWKEYDPPRGAYELEGNKVYLIKCPCGSKINVTSKISAGVAKIIEEIQRMRDYDL